MKVNCCPLLGMPLPLPCSVSCGCVCICIHALRLLAPNALSSPYCAPCLCPCRR
jgi:hypothetical protein